jgi:CubicO group peptidase (beta-lactamase class C family)
VDRPLLTAAAPHVAPDRIPGLVALIARGDDVQVETLGTLDAEPGRPVRRDSLFRIASTSKPITAVATLILVEEGLLGLDDPVDELLPELADRRVLRAPDAALADTVAAHRPITVRDLLTFTFGFGLMLEMFTSPTRWPIVAAAEDELHLSTLDPPDPSVMPPPDAWIAGLGSLPLMAQPGERWLYNTGTGVLGVLLARAAGRPFADVLRARIFEPLGMHDTGFFTTETDRLATAYRPTPNGLVAWDRPDGTWSRPPAFCDGGAGLLSTADDLLAFARMLLRGGAPILPSHAVAEMTRDQLTPEQKARGGLGPGFFETKSWGYGLAVYDGGAYGWDGGFGCSFRVDPARELTTIVLTQKMFEDPSGDQVHRDIQAAAMAES